MANMTDIVSSATRGCIIAPSGKKLVISDLSNIEGRMLAWLANEQWKLKAFSDADKGTGEDLYKLTYAKMFGIDVSNVNGMKRQIGKTLELSMGYQGGVKAFLTSALKFNIYLEELANIAWPTIPPAILTAAEQWYEISKDHYGLSKRVFIACDALKRMWRQANPNIENFWHDIEDAVKQAIHSPGREIYCGHIKVICNKTWLRLVMPSGRSLCYPGIKLQDNQITYMGINSYTRKWERLKTYGGKLVENLVQALSRDVMAHNMPYIEKAGYHIVLTVHDEVLTEVPDNDNYSEKALSHLLCNTPTWADEFLPLNASGFEAYRYRKD